MTVFEQFAGWLQTALVRHAARIQIGLDQCLAADAVQYRLGQFATAVDNQARTDALTQMAHAHHRLAELRPDTAGLREAQTHLLHDLADLYRARTGTSPRRGWAHGRAPDVVVLSMREMAQTDHLRFHRDNLLRARAAIGRGDPRAAVLDLIAQGLHRAGALLGPTERHLRQAFSPPWAAPRPATVPPARPVAAPAPGRRAR